MAVDILAFGAHPDDIEIGLGGCLARHAAEGHKVGLCDLTAGELGSNGTPDERRAEAAAAASVLGAVTRENLGWPDGGITGAPDQLRSAVDCIRRLRPRTVAIPVLAGSTPGPRRREPGAHDRVPPQRPAPLRDRSRGMAPGLGLLLLHQRRGAALVRRRRVVLVRDQARGARLPQQPVRASRRRAP